MGFNKQLIKDGVDKDDYYSLRCQKRELISVIHAHEKAKRFSRLKLPPDEYTVKKLRYYEENNMSISDIEKYISYITKLLNKIKKEGRDCNVII